MIERPQRFLEEIYQQFTEYYDDFLNIADQASTLFLAGEVDTRLQHDLLRVQLYRLAIDKSTRFARETLDDIYNRDGWEQLRELFQKTYDDELATTYFTSVMRKIFARKDIPIEYGDDGIAHGVVPPDRLVNHSPIQKNTDLGDTLHHALTDSVFGDSLADTLDQDIDIFLDIINEYLKKDVELLALETLQLPFFRGKGAYLIGRLQTTEENIPLVFSCLHSTHGVKIDAVLIGYKVTRSFLFSSTRSSFTVSTRYYRELYSFLRQLFPRENQAYILDIIGFTHPAKIWLLQQLRQLLEQGGQLRFFGIGPIDFVFGMKGFPLVFKILRGDLPDRQAVINNFIKVHTIDRLGQILDSLDYRNLKFPRSQFSRRLLDKLEREHSEDVIMTDDHIFLKRLYLARRITPIMERVRTGSKTEARQLLLMVGWNIKHLAAMGFFPTALSLAQFGLTSWGRVVYLDNPALLDIRLFHFRSQQHPPLATEKFHVDPADIEEDLIIPQPHRDTFRAIHGDLFSVHFWEDIKQKVISSRYPDFFPYPARYRLESRKFHRSVLEELQRISDRVDAKQIYMALDKLAVVDVELAGLSFLRLEVPSPSARVLVVEPIGPEIIAQLHRRFEDITFDILEPESEIVEGAGQWTPGIHGKLNALVQVRRYDYVIGYVNEAFDEDFFRLARLKGFLLLSTGTHNIDVQAATRFHTVVTNAPGPTTTTVAEQNIGLILDALYCPPTGRDGLKAGGTVRITDNPSTPFPPLLVAQLMWLSLLQKTLQLDTMFAFGASEMYVRTGVGESATVYHDQIGQNKEAGILRSIGILGLDPTGVHLIEFAIAHEVAAIYVLESEYTRLSLQTKERFEEMIAIKSEISSTDGLSIRIIPVHRTELFDRADYTFSTEIVGDDPPGYGRAGRKIHIDIHDIAVPSHLDLLDSSLRQLTLGIQGLGRIGEAVAQRAIVLGKNILIFQREPGRPKYQTKLANLNRLAAHHARWTDQPVTVNYAASKDEFFKKSNIITTLATTTDQTRGWLDHHGLEQFASSSPSPVQIIVSAGKGLVDEDALLRFLQKHPHAQARLDILVDEHEGGAYRKILDDTGRPLANIQITGHTAAAVREVRQLKIYKALDNLRMLVDGRIPPNIVNNFAAKGKSVGTQSIVDIEGLRFFRMTPPSPKARVLVIEPLSPEIILSLQQNFADVSFDILLAESELVEEDGCWAPGINSRLNAIAADHYDYCLGYCNANFDGPFFRQTHLKALILFSTATHHIDLQTATQMGTTVTNSPGFTTVAVTEQNVAMALEALFGRYVQDTASEDARSLAELELGTPRRQRTAAQILWFMLLKKALKLDNMYEFGMGDKYVRTGVRQDATVYHDQLGQYADAGIQNKIGIIGLDEVGVNLIELAIIYELSTILVLEEEYRKLTEQQRSRLDSLLELLPDVSQTKPLAVQLQLVDHEEMLTEATYAIKTPAACASPLLRDIKPRGLVNVLADKVYVNDMGIFDRSLIGLTCGIQGLGRIGEAVVQRLLGMGAEIIICQRDPGRARYREKLERLRRLSRNRAEVYEAKIDLEYVDKERLFTASNIVTTLAATTAQTRYWVDREALDMLGRDAQGPVRILVNAGKGLLNEADLAPFLRERPDVEVRLDVLTDEQRGKAGSRFLDAGNRPLANLKIAGHTAAAVPELRRLKILNALNNLRLHIDGGKPNNILNP